MSYQKFNLPISIISLSLVINVLVYVRNSFLKISNEDPKPRINSSILGNEALSPQAEIDLNDISFKFVLKLLYYYLFNLTCFYKKIYAFKI